MYFDSEHVHDMWQNQPRSSYAWIVFKKQCLLPWKKFCLHTSIICSQMTKTECNQWGNKIIWYSSRWFYLDIFCKQNKQKRKKFHIYTHSWKSVLQTRRRNCKYYNRVNHRTTDSIFILKSLLIKYLTKKKSKVYSCFVDLRRAFDTVWHAGLLYKLNKDNVGKQLFEVIKDMYNSCESSVKIENEHWVFLK